MRHLLLPVCALLAVAACSSSTTKSAPDANTPASEPAVITVPEKLPILEQAKDTTKAMVSTLLIPADPLKRQIAVMEGYALATATMINHDARVLSKVYAPDATLTTPDSTLSGVVAVAKHLIGLAQSKSLADFQRTSRGMRIIDDSTLADSGTYVMVLKRSAKDSVMEHGTYRSHWRARKNSSDWVILEDHLTPTAGKKRAK